MMSKVFHMHGLQAHKEIMYHLIFLLVSLNSVWAGILIFDGDLGIEEFRDIELSNTEPISSDGIMGAIVAASPMDACVNISRPPSVNISLNWFVLIAGNSCTFEVKVLNARNAGYAAAVIYVYETKVPHFIRTENGYYSYFPNISAVVIGSDQGHRIRDNYLFGIDDRFRIYIFPNNSFSIMTFLLLFSIVTGLFLVVMLVFAVIRFFQHSSSVQRGRLSSRHLKQLQTSTYNKGNGSDSCAICLEEYKDQDKLRFLPCSHGYHARCIDPWLTNNRPICPVCKQKVVLEGNHSENSRDSDFDERSETTPLLHGRKETQHGTFNLIYNPAGENVGDLNLPSTSVSKNIGRVKTLRQSVSSLGGGDSSNILTENLSSENKSTDSAPKNVGVIKRLVFLKNSPENLGNISISTSSSTGLSADPVTANLNVTDLPGDSSVVDIGLSSNLETTNIGDGVIMSSTGSENFSERNLSRDSAVANISSTNLPSESISGYVTGMNLSKFWPSDHLNKIKLSKDTLSGNQDGLNLSSDVSVNVGDINLPSDDNVKLDSGNLSSKSAAVGDISLPDESISINLDNIKLTGKKIVTNLGDINVSTDSFVADIGGVTVPSVSVAANLGDEKVSSDLKCIDVRAVAAIDSATSPNEPVAANLRGINVSSDLKRTDLSGIVEAIDSAIANIEAANVSGSTVVTDVGVRVSKKVVPIDLDIDESLTANLDGSNLSSRASVSTNLGEVKISSPSISGSLGDVNVSSPSVSTNLGDVNVSSPLGAISKSSISVSSPSIGSNLKRITVSTPTTVASHGGMTISSPSAVTSLRDINVSSAVAPKNLGINLSSPLQSNIRGFNVSSPTVAASHSGITVSSPSVTTSLRDVNISTPVSPINLGINLSSPTAAMSHGDMAVSRFSVAGDVNVSSPPVVTSLGDINVSSSITPTNLGISLPSGSATELPSDVSSPNKPPAANRRRRRNFK